MSLCYLKKLNAKINELPNTELELLDTTLRQNRYCQLCAEINTQAPTASKPSCLIKIATIKKLGTHLAILGPERFYIKTKLTLPNERKVRGKQPVVYAIGQAKKRQR